MRLYSQSGTFRDIWRLAGKNRPILDYDLDEYVSKGSLTSCQPQRDETAPLKTVNSFICFRVVGGERDFKVACMVLTWEWIVTFSFFLFFFFFFFFYSKVGTRPKCARCCDMWRSSVSDTLWTGCSCGAATNARQFARCAVRKWQPVWFCVFTSLGSCDVCFWEDVRIKWLLMHLESSQFIILNYVLVGYCKNNNNNIYAYQWYRFNSKDNLASYLNLSFLCCIAK